MKRILTSILLLFIVTFAPAEESARIAVAKVDFNEVDDLLVKVVLSKKGNNELRDRYYAKKRAEKEAQNRMQEKIVRGESFNPMEAAKSFMHDDTDKKKVQQLCEKHLLELIEVIFDGRYDLVFKDDYRSSLIYSKITIDDVTVIIKQELLKALPQE
ncbi:hypothetical protein [Rubritalea marina]|uniref:hypothetical protein n=1 Tax=Rubritalea marina TaxID=361055 RepID=UPI000374A6C6|nr:hypothetical protein [Rubritalea marina]